MPKFPPGQGVQSLKSPLQSLGRSTGRKLHSAPPLAKRRLAAHAWLHHSHCNLTNCRLSMLECSPRHWQPWLESLPLRALSAGAVYRPPQPLVLVPHQWGMPPCLGRTRQPHEPGPCASRFRTQQQTLWPPAYELAEFGGSELMLRQNPPHRQERIAYELCSYEPWSFLPFNTRHRF